MIRLRDEQGRPMVFGHRGCPTMAPENTLAGFALIRNHGIPAVELDVHQCAGGEVVVCHDASLRRTGGVDLRIGSATLAELREHSVGAWFGPGFAAERIPLLEEVLELLGTRCFYDVEIKHYRERPAGVEDACGIEAETIRLLRRHGVTARCIVSSFNPLILRRVRRIAADIPVAVIYENTNGVPFLLRRGAGRLIAGASVMKPHQALATPSHVERHRRRGRTVIAWTVDDPQTVRDLAEGGVDGIVSNTPLETLGALGS